MRELVLGGMRSGKSRYAEQTALQQSGELLYLATATAGDEEMVQRIEHHRQQRGERWGLVEEPIHIADVLSREAATERVVVVDCLTLWITNLLLDSDPALLQQECDKLLEVLPTLSGRIILVSNETGLGVVPMDPLSRRFCDEAGRLHQRLAAQCERVTWMVAGIPSRIKDEMPESE